jgi:DNA-3-methyladenine glycosylase
MKLTHTFYQDKNVVAMAKRLLGKVLITNLSGGLTSGMIVETEAYSWRERGCHAFQGHKTKRNAPMFNAGGSSYVYLCYGMYELFNVVTNQAGVAEAVLIRALQPIDGEALMLERCMAKTNKRITSGPGKLTRALGISRQHNQMDLCGDRIWIEDNGVSGKQFQYCASVRIGLNTAGLDARLPWRFTIKDNQWVSR